VTLVPKDLQLDCDGDPQLPMQWKQQTVMSADGERTFWYAELTENDHIKLTKLNAKKKLLYTNGLCRLKFLANFTVKS
jgi:hypothetical protein